MCDNYPKCQGEQLFYHCVRINSYTLLEACAPMHKIIGKQTPNVKITNYISISDIETLKLKWKMYFNFKYINFFKGKHCPVFEKQLGRVVEDYNTHCSECPIGYDSYNYVYIHIWRTTLFSFFLNFHTHST